MQFRAILVGCCLLTTNFLNIMVPRQLGIITNALIAGEFSIDSLGENIL
jgi:hypothetical protein